MNKIVLIIGIGIGFHSYATNDHTISQQEYVEKWQKTAISQMMENNIPASITLAQGILESANGNSELARKGNNHFGIKCHDWEGKKIYIDDDKNDECFRVYKSADQSYEDHSAFLKQYERYAFLFAYGTEDYASWAEGLKTAGYATNPKYPKLLIVIIEDLKLYELDKLSNPEILKQPSLVAASTSNQKIRMNTHIVLNHSNEVKYVVAKKGDTFYSISKEFGLSLNQLHRYNDFERNKDVLTEGDLVYIQPKRHRNLFHKKEWIAEKDMTLKEVSQQTAVSIKAIKRLNNIDNDAEIIAKGKKITLR